MRLSKAILGLALAGFVLTGRIDAGRDFQIIDFEPLPSVADEPAKDKSDSDTGIREIVPSEFQERYQKWKNDLLSTDFGRKQWERYSSDRHFLLKIVVSSDKKFGAGTGDYKWDDDGKLVGATITLGRNLDRGYPDPVYYP